MSLSIFEARSSHEFLRILGDRHPIRDLTSTHPTSTSWIGVDAACRLLATLARANLIAFPLSVNCWDRPHFRIVSGNLRIALNVVTAIPPQTADDELRRSNASREEKPTPTVEEQWALLMHRRVATQSAELLNVRGREHDFDWLTILDTLPLEDVGLGRATNLLGRLLRNYWSRPRRIHMVFIHHKSVIVRIHPLGSDHLVVHDQWGAPVC